MTLIKFLRKFFRRSNDRLIGAEKVRLPTRTVYVVPPSARFVIDAENQYDMDSETDGQKFLADLIRATVEDADGNPVCGDDPFTDLDCKELLQIRPAAFRAISYQGDPEKNSLAGQDDDS